MVINLTKKFATKLSIEYVNVSFGSLIDHTHHFCVLHNDKNCYSDTLSFHIFMFFIVNGENSYNKDSFCV